MTACKRLAINNSTSYYGEEGTNSRRSVLSMPGTALVSCA